MTRWWRRLRRGKKEEGAQVEADRILNDTQRNREEIERLAAELRRARRKNNLGPLIEKALRGRT